MKITHLLAAAGLMVATLGVGTAAEAQPGRHDRGDHRWDNHDRGRHNGWNRHDRRRHPVCRTVWRHHHRVRVCR